jgi:gamma-glutamylcyclotransferase (GGCT)/AIG2-like uncharacterized protein YtfP
LAEEQKTGLLFVYGSLMSGGERGHFLDRDHKVRFLGMAITYGTLYDLGDFVGLIETENGPPVRGELYEVIDEETFFATLDVIEGYWPKEPGRSLYIRKLIPVETSGGLVYAFAYIYNQPVNGFPIIASGQARSIQT